MPPWKPPPKPIPAMAVPAKKPAAESAEHRRQRHRDAGHERSDAQVQDRPGLGPVEGQHRSGRDPGQDEQAQPAVHDGRRVQQGGGERGAERPVEAGQCPHREQHRRGDGDLAAHRGRQPDVRHQAPQRAWPARGRLPHGQHPRGLDAEHPQQDQVDQVRRVREVLDGQRRDQRARGGADARGERVGHRAAPPVQVEHPGPDRAQRGAGRESLHDPGDQQRPEPSGPEEQHRGHRLHGEPGEQHRPPPGVVRQPAERQQAGQHRERVHAEHHRRRQRREPPPRRVQRVHRRRRRRGGEERDHDRAEQHQRQHLPPPASRLRCRLPGCLPGCLRCRPPGCLRCLSPGRQPAQARSRAVSHRQAALTRTHEHPLPARRPRGARPRYTLTATTGQTDLSIPTEAPA